MRRLAGCMPVGQEGSAVWRSGLSGKVTCVAVGQGCEHSVKVWCPMKSSMAYPPTQPWLPRHRYNRIVLPCSLLTLLPPAPQS